MSSETDDAVWDVIIESDGTSSFFSLPISLSLEEVQRRWIGDCGLTERFSRGYFCTQEGTRLQSQQRLRDVGDPRLRMAKLVFTPAELLDVIVSRVDGSGKRMYEVPVSCLASEVCSRWREEVEESEEGDFFTQGHVLVRPEQTVSDIGDARQQMAKLLFERAVAPTCDVIVTESGGRRRHYKLPIVSPVRDVFARWCEDCGETRGRFLTPDESDVAMEQQIGLVHAFNAEQRMLRLLFERHEELQIDLCDETRAVEVALSQTPAEVWPIIRRTFGLQEERHFQLRSCGRVLDSRLSFSTQEVQPGDSLILELSLDLNFHHAWEKLSVQMEDVFPTDDCLEVLQEMQGVIRAQLKVKRQREESMTEEKPPSDADLPPWLCERLQLLEIAYADSCHSSESEEEDTEVTIRASEAALAFTGPVGDALAALGAPRQRCFDLRVEQKRTVSLLDGARIQQTEVWPSQTVADVVPHPLIDHDGELARDRFEELLVPDNGLLVVKPLLLQLQLSDGQRHVVRLAPAATVGDLRQIACGFERQNFVHLSCGEQTLGNDNCALGRAGLVDDDPVIVRRNDLEMSVSVRGQTDSWRPQRERIDWNDVAMRLSKLSQSPIKEVRDWTLRCAGCERRVTKDCVIPVDCCETRSTQLTETTLEVHTDADSIQRIQKLTEEVTSLRLRIKQILEEKESLESNEQRLLRERVQSDVRFQRLQKEKEEEEFGNTDALISERDKLQQLNAGLTKDNQKLTKLKADTLKEKERLKKTNADLLKEKENYLKDINDILTEKERLKTQNTDLRKENKRLKLWNGVLNEVNERKKTDQLFFIQKEVGGDIPRMSLILPPAPTTGQVRAQIALKMGWRPEETQLGRRMGLVGDGRVFWADQDGKRDFVFADVTGQVYQDSVVKDWEREDLRDDSDHFPLIRKFVNVVRVARRRR